MSENKSQALFTAAEVAKHNTPNDAYIIIDGIVYDISKFAKLHPGGVSALMRVAGTDATAEFKALHGPHVLNSYSKLVVGKLQPSETDSNEKKSAKTRKTTSVSSVVKYTPLHSELGKPFGCSIPFSEPGWYFGQPSPYYNKSHSVFRAYVRDFVEREMIPYCHQWDESGTYPPELHTKLAAAGLTYAASRYALKPYGNKFGKPKFGDTGLDFDEFDEFHDVILADELSRTGCGGIIAAVFVSLAISIPPLMLVGSENMQNRIVPDLLAGRKIICLAISEPYIGSDVAGLKTTAEKVNGPAPGVDVNNPSTSAEDKSYHYVINGAKKFITSGVKADYFVVAVRTGAPGVGGISLIMLEKGMPGLQSRRLKTQGWWSSNTALVTMDSVRVPPSALIGEENQGFLPIMFQFNKERYMGIISTTRFARVCIEDAVKHGRQRQTFGKRLMDHQVLRHKVVEMARMVEANQAHMEILAYQMKNGMDQRELSKYMGLLKVQCTKTLEFCAREASQILGGASYIRGGVGERVERIYREVRVNAIGGGSEEVMMDLVAKQAKL